MTLIIQLPARRQNPEEYPRKFHIKWARLEPAQVGIIQHSQEHHKRQKLHKCFLLTTSGHRECYTYPERRCPITPRRCASLIRTMVYRHMHPSRSVTVDDNADVDEQDLGDHPHCDMLAHWSLLSRVDRILDVVGDLVIMSEPPHYAALRCYLHDC